MCALQHFKLIRFSRPLNVEVKDKIKKDEPCGLVFARRDEADDVFVEALRGHVHFDIGGEAPLVAAFGDGGDGVEGFGDGCHTMAPIQRPTRRARREF